MIDQLINVGLTVLIMAGILTAVGLFLWVVFIAVPYRRAMAVQEKRDKMAAVMGVTGRKDTKTLERRDMTKETKQEKTMWWNVKGDLQQLQSRQAEIVEDANDLVPIMDISMPPVATITIGAEGKRLELSWPRGELEISGDLPLSEAAELFFEVVLKRYVDKYIADKLAEKPKEGY